MDNLAHTLVGAALGRAVAGRWVPGAALVGAVASNAPDWAELLITPRAWAPRTGVAYLLYHRGVTHSLLGAAVEIIGLSVLVGLVLRWWARRRGGGQPAWPRIAACVAATVVSHVYLDWQGSYGLRPFLPWSARWYYADWVAIVDPLFWGLPLVALAWGAARGGRGGVGGGTGRGCSARPLDRPRRGRALDEAGGRRPVGRLRNRVGAALVRAGRWTAGGAVRGPGPGRLRGRAGPGQRAGQDGRTGERNPALRPGRRVGRTHRGRPAVPMGADVRERGYGGGPRLGRAASPDTSCRRAGTGDAGGPHHRALRAVSRGGSGFERRRLAGVPARRALRPPPAPRG